MNTSCNIVADRPTDGDVHGAPVYSRIVRHYEECLAEHGPTHRGVDWPNAGDLALRFDTMLGIVRDDPGQPVRLLDLGCGPGLLLDHLAADTGANMRRQIVYSGIDVSPLMIEAARARHPAAAFEARDIIVDPLPEMSVDYVIMNGVLTEKRDLAQGDMENFAVNLIEAAFAAARHGVSFNVMSMHVDWQRDDLFHWPFDRMAACLRHLTRHIAIRADYGLYEYTTYLYRSATDVSNR